MSRAHAGEYRSTIEPLDAAGLLLGDQPEPEGERPDRGGVVIVTHAKPDGDAAGSVIALREALRLAGRTAVGVLAPPVTASLQQLEGAGDLVIWQEGLELDEPELLVITDTGAWSQVGPLRPFVEARLDKTLIIDHHLSGDIEARWKLIDPTAAAACELLTELIGLMAHLRPRKSSPQAGVGPHARPASLLNTRARDALFAGIASDTGWFRFSNTTARTHRLAAELLDAGTDHAALYALLEQTDAPEKMGLIARALGSMELLADGAAAVMVLRDADFAETGATSEMTERLIDLPQQIASVQVVALVTESQTPQGDPQTRISFRSKPGDQAVNVADLAGHFGGGGHARAAGAKVDREVDVVLPEVRAAVQTAAD
jgi:phosphoesterase RecJ-like protein